MKKLMMAFLLISIHSPLWSHGDDQTLLPLHHIQKADGKSEATVAMLCFIFSCSVVGATGLLALQLASNHFIGNNG